MVVKISQLVKLGFEIFSFYYHDLRWECVIANITYKDFEIFSLNDLLKMNQPRNLKKKKTKKTKQLVSIMLQTGLNSSPLLVEKPRLITIMN